MVAAHSHLEGPLLPILHAVQEQLGYVPTEAIPTIARALNLTRAEVFGVVSFYHDFKDKPVGRHVVRLCRAESCQSMGGVALAERAREQLGVDWGETSPEGVTLEPVYCLGLCSFSPSAMIDGKLHGRLTAERLDALIAECRR
ncbi:formate dehydrogenase subunit gamma [Consotaella sp. CSK11QG-6]